MPPPDDKTVIARQPPAPEQPPASSESEAEAEAEAEADDDRTVVMPTPRPAGGNAGASTGAAAASGTATAVASAPHALPVGTRLAEFEIVRLIGEGGFGIVYLADDTQLGRRVALKEYIPAALASRGGDAQVTVKSERHAETFRAGLKSFINEARLLAQFDHQSLVKVYRFWEANGTAYMVMPYYEGDTLKDALRQMPAPPDEDWLRALLAPLVEALAVLHGAQCFHRDIAPDNILLLKGSGRPLLLDFGAARRVIGDMTQALTVILKPGYAPVEQYAEVPSMKQGPWTDLYALAAVVYYAILGKTPPAAVGRLVNDTYAPLAVTAAGRYSDGFLRAIDHALAVQPQDRTQHVFALAAELGLDVGGDSDVASGVAGAGAVSADDDVTRVIPREAPRQATAAASAAGNRGETRAGTATMPSAADAAPARTGGGKRPATLAAIVAGVVAVAGIGGWWALRSSSPPTVPATIAHAPVPAQPSAAGPAPQPVTNAAAPATATSPSASITATQPAGAESSAPPSAALPATPLAAAQPPAAAPLPPYTPDGELERIASLADPSFRVTTTLRSTVARINHDHLEFRLGSSRAGYAYVFMVDPDGQYLMLFPNALDKNNAIAAGETLNLPRSSWPMLAGAPAGPNHFLAIVSPVPRDFGDGGLHRGPVFAAFPPDARRAAAARRTARYSPFAGKPRCGAGGADCPDTFGASTFTIDVVN